MRQLFVSLFSKLIVFLFPITLILAPAAQAQENPYFVTYDHHLEESGDLETSVYTMIGLPRAGQSAYYAPLFELEYGVRDWWTTSLYLEGQGTSGDSGVFTGWRFENRFRPFEAEHRVNPVLYLEYENINEASRVQKEIVGNSSDFSETIADASSVHSHELESKLILSSDVRHWNVSENFVFEKNFSESEGVEFGYALGVARPLASADSGTHCVWCRRSVAAGLEMYGGLGSTHGFGLHDTSHYVAPVVSWNIGENSTLHFSPGFGVTAGSSPVLLRVGYSYQIEGFGGKVKSMLRGKE
jgi:hypothetical protein